MKRAAHPEPRVREAQADDRDQRAAEKDARRLADTPVEGERDVSPRGIPRVEARRGHDDPRREQHDQYDERDLHDGDEMRSEREATEEQQRDDAAAEDRERRRAVLEAGAVE